MQSLLLGSSHAGRFAFMRVDRNQESVPVGIREFVPLHIGAVLQGAIHGEAAVILSSEIFDILQNHSLTIRTALTLQLHRSHLATTTRSVYDVPSTADLDRRFLHF